MHAPSLQAAPEVPPGGKWSGARAQLTLYQHTYSRHEWLGHPLAGGCSRCMLSSRHSFIRLCKWDCERPHPPPLLPLRVCTLISMHARRAPPAADFTRGTASPASPSWPRTSLVCRSCHSTRCIRRCRRCGAAARGRASSATPARRLRLRLRLVRLGPPSPRPGPRPLWSSRRRTSRRSADACSCTRAHALTHAAPRMPVGRRPAWHGDLHVSGRTWHARPLGRLRRGTPGHLVSGSVAALSCALMPACCPPHIQVEMLLHRLAALLPSIKVYQAGGGGAVAGGITVSGCARCVRACAAAE